MEEWVGQQWHRLITRAAQTDHPAAAVGLDEVQRTLGLLFRAGGGPGAAKLGAGTAQAVGGPRGWLQRVAGSGRQAHLAQREPERMNLPPRIAVFSERHLNRALYLWLASMGAVWDEAAQAGAGWVADNRAAARRVLQRFPGLAPSWQQLLRAQLALRPDPARLPAAEQASERALQAALAASLAGEETDAAGAWRALTPDRLAPVGLAQPGQHPGRHRRSRPRAGRDTGPARGRDPTVQDDTRRRARRTDEATQRGGLMMFFRAESILSWGEYVKVHRATDDDPDPQAAKVADDFDTLSLAQGGERLASRVRFDLDLPSAAADDLPLGPGQTLPEWDWRQRRLLPDHCVVQTLAPRDPAPGRPRRPCGPRPAGCAATWSAGRRRPAGAAACPRARPWTWTPGCSTAATTAPAPPAPPRPASSPGGSVRSARWPRCCWPTCRRAPMPMSGPRPASPPAPASG
jgi:nitric oxide reductase NorD protein